MFDKIREFFAGIGTGSFEQDQNEAILLMLVWAMRSDGKLEPEESEKIQIFIESMNWDSEMDVKDYLLQSTLRIKQLEAGKLTADELLEECSAKLHGKEIRYKAVQICHELAQADGYFERAEKNLLKMYSKKLL